MIIIWSINADITIEEIVNDIENKFTSMEAEKFIEQTFNALTTIENFSKLYSRKCF